MLALSFAGCVGCGCWQLAMNTLNASRSHKGVLNDFMLSPSSKICRSCCEDFITFCRGFPGVRVAASSDLKLGKQGEVIRRLRDQTVTNHVASGQAIGEGLRQEDVVKANVRAPGRKGESRVRRVQTAVDRKSTRLNSSHVAL